MSAKEYKRLIAGRIRDTIKEWQFQKRGNNFIYSNGDLTYYISLQSSRMSTANVLRLTINTAIASGLISKLDDTSLPIEQQRHYTRRIGNYTDEQQDKWWTVNNMESAAIAAQEIADLIISRIIPHFDSLRTTTDLEALWKNGGYTGITESQRRNYLTLLAKYKG